MAYSAGVGKLAVRMTARDWACIDAEMGTAEAAARQDAGDVSTPSRVRAAGARLNLSPGAVRDSPAEGELVTVALTLDDWHYVIGTLIKAQEDYARLGESQRRERCRQAHVVVARTLGGGGGAVSVRVRLAPADPGDTAAMERHRRLLQHFGAEAAGMSEEERRAAQAAALRRRRRRD